MATKQKTTTSRKKTAPKTAAVKTAAKPAGKPWLDNYPETVAAEIDPLPHASLGEFLVDCSKTYADRPAYSCMGKTMTFAEVEQMSHALAGYLQSRGLTPPEAKRLMLQAFIAEAFAGAPDEEALSDAALQRLGEML